MADIQHSSLTGSELHEPKGADTASTNQVYVADGAGSGSWSDIFQYANLYTLESDAVTVSTIGTTAQTFPFSNNGESNGEVADATNNKITCTEAGVYFVSFSVSFSTNAVGDAGLYEFKLLDDGSATGYGTARQMSGSSDTGSASFIALLDVAANSDLTIQVESDEAGDTDDIDIYSASLVVFKVG